MDNLFKFCVKMYRDRAAYHFKLADENREINMSFYERELYQAMTYDTCANMLEDALAGNDESLRQYDYYGEE